MTYGYCSGSQGCPVESMMGGKIASGTQERGYLERGRRVGSVEGGFQKLNLHFFQLIFHEFH
ncbi:hypothetical protein GMSM_43340 [Geomonas sp. Red276]